MMDTKVYKLTDEQFANIKKASRPTPVMKIGNGYGSTPQENANRAWKEIAKEHGVDWETITPVSNKGERFFRAESLDDE